MFEFDKLFDEHLEHVSETLKESPRSHTIRTKAALECGAELTFVIYIEEGQQSIDQQKSKAYEQTFNRYSQPSGHQRAQKVVNPVGDNR